MKDIHNFYILISNRQNKTRSACQYKLHPTNKIYIDHIVLVYWQIKKIHVEDVKAPDKFDKMINAIRERKSIMGYSTVLWDVRKLYTI